MAVDSTVARESGGTDGTSRKAGNRRREADRLLTILFTFKATAAETNDALAIAELDADPAVGPPPHIHRDADESFYILEGTFDFSLDGRPFSAGTGSFVLLPRGIVHTHWGWLAANRRGRS